VPAANGLIIMETSTGELTAILNYLPYSPDLATAGQPTAVQLAAIRQVGFEVVINLATPASTNALPDEAGTVAALGMAYVPIPVIWERPALDDLAAFFDALEQHAGRKVFVHCALNWRVSTFMYLYRTIRHGVPHDTAVWELLSIWEPDDTWARFIADAFDHYGIERPASP
jgi:protein tyrosine phosphatase (PTP) superfamily phosphohydrolase (DUF442 family)